MCTVQCTFSSILSVIKFKYKYVKSVRYTYVYLGLVIILINYNIYCFKQIILSKLCNFI